MNCKQFGDRLLDVAAGTTPDGETRTHLKKCDACAERLAGLMETMAVLDDWKVPEPSPYFDSRLRARLREVQAAPARSWLDWLRKPVLVAAMGGLLVAGLTLYKDHESTVATPNRAQIIDITPGSAVSDLQTLDKNHELLANFDLLDDLDSGDMGAVTANP
jgi:hypothetical protein